MGGGHGAVPSPLWSRNFQSIISQTNNGCNLFSPILAKLLLLDISCENIFALFVETPLTAMPFFHKKVC